MNSRSIRLAAVAACIGALVEPLWAQPVEVCKLVPKDEVKRHLPWIDALDQLPIEEEAIGTSGSSCN